LIIFENVRYKNFLSSGNIFTEIPLNKHQTTLVVGSNGHGKTTLIDAIIFCLYGKPFRNINKPQLVNSINNKDCVVEVEFKIGKVKYKVVRGVKPNIFEIYQNGVRINQDAASKDYQDVLESNILKISYKSFTQVVILGSTNFTPFMQLTANDRRAVIEDLLDIKIFSQMNTIVKNKNSLLKDQLRDITQKLSSCKEKMNLHRTSVEIMNRNNDALLNVRREQIAVYRQEIADLEQQSEILNNELVEVTPNPVFMKATSDRLNNFIKIRDKLSNGLDKARGEYDFYSNNSTCSMCSQELHNHGEILNNYAVKIIELEEGLSKIEISISKLTVKNDKNQSDFGKANELTNQLLNNKIKIEGVKSNIIALEGEITDIEKNSLLKDHNAQIAQQLLDDHTSLVESRTSVVGEIADHETALIVLKDDGVKAKIVKQYIPIINKMMNKYLNDMNFFVNFTLDQEFKETIKSRHRDVFSYDNFSEGEKKRLDLAILFTWRAISKLKNSAHTNLLIFDEVFDGALDASGIEEFMNIIHAVGSDSNVFVITHKSDQMLDKFKHLIKFEKVNGFSNIVSA